MHVKAKEEHIELTRQGMREAAARGRQIGARPIMTAADKARVMQMFKDGMRVTEIARTLGVTSGTIYNHFPGGRTGLRERGEIGGFAMASRAGRIGTGI
jgi:DNA invertase Pin-like site-specific DNA recombinase